MIKNTSGLAVQPCRLHERFYYHARLLYYILRQKARGFFARGCSPLATPICEGAGAPSALPNVGAQLPRPQRAGAPPRAPGDFRFTTKVTKGVPGLRPWTPLGALSSPQRRARRSPQKDSPIGRRGRCGLVLPSAPDRGLGLPIAFPLFRKKTAECPVGSTGRT